MRTIILGTLLVGAASATSVASFNFAGCARDYTGYLLATGYPATSGHHYVAIPSDIAPQTPAEYCVEKCTAKGTLFAAVTNANTCTCGSHHNSENDVAESNCRQASCNDAQQAPCGADGYAAVFKISPPACPSGASNYFQFGNFCFRYERSFSANWTTANHACQAEGARLATIESGHENAFVLSLPSFLNQANINDDFWAGGVYYAHSTGFEWINGRAASYFNWKSGEPAENAGFAQCLELATRTATPVDGSWALKNCGIQKPFVCKKYANASDAPARALLPMVDVVNVGADTACVPATNVYLERTRALEAHFSFDNAAVDTTAGTAADSGRHHRTGFFNFYNGLPEYHFMHNPFTNSDSLRFDGNFTVVVPSDATLERSFQNTISITAWVRPSRQANGTRRMEIIASKAMNNESHMIEFAWNLFILNNEQYCFAVGDSHACTARNAGIFKFGVDTFVAGVYDGRNVRIYVDGIQSGSSSSTLGAYVHHNASAPIVIGGQSLPMNWSSRVTFEGHLDDVRVYSSAITIGDIQYVQMCGHDARRSNLIDAYYGTDITLILNGHDLNAAEQRAGLSNNGCANGTVINTDSLPAVRLNPWGTATRTQVTFPASQLTTPANLDVCFTTVDSPDAYQGGFNVTLRIVQITSFAGGHTYTQIDTDALGEQNWISTKVEIVGVNLHDRTHVVISPFRHCPFDYGNMVATLNETSADGTTASLYLRHAPISNQYYFICWAGSMEDAMTLQRIVPTFLTIKYTGARYNSKLVAINDGTTAVTADSIIAGFHNANGNMFLECASLNNTADHYYLKVSMGEFVDFIIPAPRHTACDVLLGKEWNNTFSGDTTLYLASFHSPIDPASTFYDASMTRPIPSGAYGALGGSEAGFPFDGRTQLSQWGTAVGHGTTVGGCCHSLGHQERAWNQAYFITAHVYDNNATFFQVDERPSVVFSHEIFSIRLKLVDIHGFHRNVTGGCTFTVSQNGDVESHHSHHCDHIFRRNLTSGSATYHVTVALSEPGSTRYHLAGANSSFFTVRVVEHPRDARILHSGSNITEMLSFRSSDSITSAFYPADHDPSANLFVPSDASIEPQEEQPMTITDHHTTPAKTIDWVWKRVHAADALFGGSVAPHGVQYLAFAFYLTVQQRVAFHGGCIAYMFTHDFHFKGTFCAMFVDGKQVLAEESFFGAGWHQVIVKLVSGNAAITHAEGFWLSMEGSGMAVGVEKPLSAPNGASNLFPGAFITEFAMYRKNPFLADSIFDNNLPAGVTEFSAHPTIHDGEWWPMAAPVDGVRIAATPGMSAYQLAIYYFGCGIFTTSPGSATFEVPRSLGALRVYHNNRMVADFAADRNGPTRYFTLSFTYGGWSQLFIKASALAAHSWDMKIILTASENVALFDAPFVPEFLPAGSTDFATAPLGTVLALLSQGSSQYAFPFDTTSTTDPAAVDPSYTQVDVSSFNVAGRRETIDQTPYIWTSENAIDVRTGRFGQMFHDGGGYNRYYSFALYASRDAEHVNATVRHFEGAGVWFDSKFINGHASHGTDDGLRVHFTGVTRGWHTVHIRLQAENSLKFFPLTSASHDDAHTTCSMNGLTLCHRDLDVCPFGKPRVDIGIPLNGGAHWAAVGNGSEWVQVGSGGPKAVCGVEFGDSAVRDASEATFHAACCGLTQHPFFSFHIQASSNRSRIAWAPAVPPTPISRPTISYVAGTGSSYADRNKITVTIKHESIIAQIFYATEPNLYPTIRYTGSFEVEHITFIRAIARVENVDSPIVEEVIRVHANTTVSRHACPHNVECHVQLTRPMEPAAIFADRLIVAVDTSDAATAPSVLESVLASSRFVAEANPNTATFTDFLTVDNNNVFRIPFEFMRRRNLKEITLVEFDPSATVTDHRGITIKRPINVTAITINSQAIHRNLDFAPVSVSGGFAGGDRITFPELYVDPAMAQQEFPGIDVCSEKMCSLIGTRFPFALHGLHFVGEETVFVNTSHIHNSVLTGVKCACIETFGGLNVPFNTYAAYSQSMLVTFPTAVPLAALPPQDASKNTEIYTIGPNVISAFHQALNSTDNFFRPIGSGLDNRVRITGNFPSANAADYTVTFECANNTAATTVRFHCSQTSQPTARIAAITTNSAGATAMEVYVHARHHGHNIEGLWTLRLARNGVATPVNVPVNYERFFFIAVLPPAPTVLSAGGNCAHASEMCHNSSLVTFNGTNFNTENMHRNKVDLIDATAGMLSTSVACHVEAVSEDQLTCRIITTGPVTAGHTVNVIIRVEAIPAPRHSGEVFAAAMLNTHASLTFQKAGARGWSGSLDPSIPLPTTTAPAPPSPNGGGGSSSDDSTSNTGVIAAVVCGVVLVVGILIAVFVVTKYDLIPKARKSADSSSMNEVEESLTDTYNPEKETV